MIREISDQQAARLLLWLDNPDPRTQWKALYQLYRRLRDRDMYVDDSLAEAFFILFPLGSQVSRWMAFLRVQHDHADPYTCPRFIREMFWKKGRRISRSVTPRLP